MHQLEWVERHLAAVKQSRKYTGANETRNERLLRRMPTGKAKEKSTKWRKRPRQEASI